MQDIQKDIIRFVLDYSISSINTYGGYRGDLIVKITTKNKTDVIEIRKYALSLGIKEVVIKEKKDLDQYELYCITEDHDAYHIKTEKLLDEIHSKHTVVDAWDEGQFRK